MENKSVAQKIAAKHAEEAEQEPVKQEKVEEAVEEVVEEVVEQETQEDVIDAPQYDLSTVNQLFGRTEEDAIKDFEEARNLVNSFKEKATKADEYEKEVLSMKERIEEHNAMMKFIEENEGVYDPRSLFGGSEEALKSALLSEALKKHGVNASVVDRIMSPQFKDMDSLEIIAVGKQLKNSKLTGQDEAIKRSVLKGIGVDLDDAKERGLSTSEIIKDLTPEQRVDLDVQAGEIIDSVNGLVSKVELPDTSDPIKKIIENKKSRQEKARQLADAWQGKEIAEKLSKSLNEVDLSYEGVEFKYKVDEADKAALITRGIQLAALTGKEISDESISSIIEEAKERYIGKNAVKIYAAAIKQADLHSKERVEKEVFNGTEADMSRKDGKATTGESMRDAYKKTRKQKTPTRL